METIYVNLKSEVTRKMNDLFLAGCDTYRVRLCCNCQHGQNRRSGVLAIKGDTVVCKVIRCKGCVNRELELARPGKEEAV